MEIEEATDEVPAGFSASKKSVLLLLKRDPGATLATVAQRLGVSRAGAWKHLAALESQGWVERDYQRGPRGRPHARFRLSDCSRHLFPEAYVQTLLSALAFIEKTQGRTAVVQMLELRATELRGRHAGRLAGKEFSGKVRELGKIRDEEGYMATVKQPGKGTFELLEHNCPILAIAGKYGEACDVERRLFQGLLRADVLVSHRVVANDPICRFLIKRSNASPVV